MSKVYVYDKRPYPYYRIDNALIEVYGRHIGAYAIAVYNCLACHANRDMVAFPSYHLIGTETGTSRSTAMRAIKVLIEWNIIQLIEDGRHREGTKEFENNRYLLLPQSEWKAVDVLTETGGVTQEPRITQNTGSATVEPQVVSERTSGGVTQEHKQEPVQQNQINKNQQQESAAAVVSPNGSLSGAATDELKVLLERFAAYKVLEPTIGQFIASDPQSCETWLNYGESESGIKNAGVFALQQMKRGIAPPANTAPVKAPPKPRQTPPIAPQVIAQVLAGLHPIEREAAEAAPDTLKYLQTIHPNELANAARRLKP